MAIFAGRYTRLAPIPAITPKLIIRIGTFGLKDDVRNPIVMIILPDIQIGLKPNLFVNPPTIGPNMNLKPTNNEPTHDITAGSES